jgi:hypothetical protein
MLPIDEFVFRRTKASGASELDDDCAKVIWLYVLPVEQPT